MWKRLAALGAIACVSLPALAQAMELTPSLPGAEVRIISPADGATVQSPFTVVFGLTVMGVAPAGIDQVGTGHHHLVVSAELPSLTEPIPASNNYIHYGGGQTEGQLDLDPGEHTLQLLFGDHLHVPHDPPLISDKITVTVTE